MFNVDKLGGLFGVDWKTRFNNKTVLISLSVAILAFVYQLLALFGIVPPVTQEQLLDVVTLALNVLVILGIITDPNTPGITDGAIDKED